ncbi:HCL504Cp [Eremothecium sinecaudum]|uniref:HCL504Cp n=1 Tax=Eremothecium sinecaudum TaxID=45286 RepID=A0A109UYG2_9SACH|nr:HCL504Cp [Eremothecium sinecaudum]AMD19647.1 HCL504Cp [Eremothecium sinecaudum]
MNIVPPSDFRTNVSALSASKFTSNAVPGLPDKLREEVAAKPMNTQMNDRHPLESRLRNWDETALRRTHEQYKQIFGLAEPVKRLMELNIVEQTDFNPIGESSNIHRDILLNKECSLDWEDVFPDSEALDSSLGFSSDVHTKIEGALNIR